MTKHGRVDSALPVGPTHPQKVSGDVSERKFYGGASSFRHVGKGTMKQVDHQEMPISFLRTTWEGTCDASEKQVIHGYAMTKMRVLVLS